VTTINYNPAITISGEAGPEIEGRFVGLLQKHKEELAKMVNDVNARNGRWAIAEAR
jgi:hypothetical protein